jgi:hypothetical protein
VLARASFLRGDSGELVLKKTPPPDPLQAAFDYFGLDPSKPEDRDRLLQLLAGRLFGSRKVGRPEGSLKWTDHRLLLLGALLFQIEEPRRRLSLTKLAGKIEKLLPGHRYPSSLRKRLGAARQNFQRVLKEDPVAAAGWLYAAGYETDPERSRR